jgi:hypothetical protein
MEKAAREVRLPEIAEGSNPESPRGNGPRWKQIVNLILRFLTGAGR